MNPIRKTAAVIIKDKKILLVNGNRQNFYWTPGGKIEVNESPEDTNVRELKEELNVNVTNQKYYFTYLSDKEEDNKTREVQVFFVEYEGKLKCGAEVDSIRWISRKDIEKENINLQLGVGGHLIPKLIKDGFM